MLSDTFSPSQFYDKHSELMTSNDRTELSARSVLSVSIRIGTQIKVLRKKTSAATVPPWFKSLETVMYWSGQLRGSRMKNVKVGNRGTVRTLYVQHLWNFTANKN